MEKFKNIQVLDEKNKENDKENNKEIEIMSFYKDYNERCLWIDKDINETLFDEIRFIFQWNREDKDIPVEERKPIILMLHTYGGDIDSCFALVDIMRLSKTPIYTVNVNCSLSAGSLILMSGHKRYCMPLSQSLIHSGSGGNSGSYEQVVAQTDNYKKMMEKMQSIILEKTNVDKKTLTKWKGKEIYLYAEDQLSYGLVDEILDDITKIL